ncbi:MAG: type II/IV secretion system protein [Phycisphaerales bacterium]|nr:MAG: type II/IV secretion system protein [Phycisphaerales bacterium]
MGIGKTLVARKKITQEQLDSALAARRNPGERVEKLLVQMGFVTERDVLEIIGEQLHIPVVDLNEVEIDKELLKQIPETIVHRYNLLPIDRTDGTIRVATSNAFNLYAFDELRMITGSKIEPVLAAEADIVRVIKQYFGVGGGTIRRMIGDDEVEVVSDHAEENGDLIEAAQEATVVKLVNEILIEAIRDRASDVHIEPYEHNLRIRYRIDGVLHTTNVPPEIRRFQNAIISRIKILSNLNIAERRLPQDGGFKIKTGNREIDLRVSIIPTAFGEAVVMRILDKASVLLSLNDLGMVDQVFEDFERLIRQPHGIVLVTGPTGSGKTTTLYAALNSIKSDKIKVLTVEDPIEYYLDGIQQVGVQRKIGLTFAFGLRSFLRHDPDVILVGEIRDLETAEVAVNASLTGHLVFSTLHTNDAPTANTRLLDMGVEPFLVSSSIEGVLAQRLVRRVCEFCKEPYEPDAASIPPDFDREPGEPLYHGAGCRECRHTGYKGRMGIFELLVMNDEIRNLIVNRGTATDVMTLARKKYGMRLLREDGWDKVRAGLTTIDEVMRVSKIV